MQRIRRAVYIEEERLQAVRNGIQRGAAAPAGIMKYPVTIIINDKLIQTSAELDAPSPGETSPDRCQAS